MTETGVGVLEEKNKKIESILSREGRALQAVLHLAEPLITEYNQTQTDVTGEGLSREELEALFDLSTIRTMVASADDKKEAGNFLTAEEHFAKQIKEFSKGVSVAFGVEFVEKPPNEEEKQKLVDNRPVRSFQTMISYLDRTRDYDHPEEYLRVDNSDLSQRIEYFISQKEKEPDRFIVTLHGATEEDSEIKRLITLEKNTEGETMWRVSDLVAKQN